MAQFWTSKVQNNKYGRPTINVRFDCTEIGHKSSTVCLFVSHHLQHHGVCGWNESAGAEGSAKPTQFLHQVGKSVVDVDIVVATLRVGLQVKNAESEHDHISLWDLDSEQITYESGS